MMLHNFNFAVMGKQAIDDDYV
jgi:electron transfer flavoprotein beta subunit